MDVLKDVMKYGPMASLSYWTQGIIVSIFSLIVVTLFTMLVLLFTHGMYANIQFGY